MSERFAAVMMLASLGRLLRANNGALFVQALGVLSIFGGLWMVYPPAALIVAGLGLVIIGAGIAPDTRSE
jgi:hypothetical protein